MAVNFSTVGGVVTTAALFSTPCSPCCSVGIYLPARSSGAAISAKMSAGS
jgi:hypothetical protein